MGEARRRRGRAPGPLPRGTCSVCGNEFALRASRTLGQHQRRTAQGYRIGRCPGVDQPPVGLKTVENTVTGADVTAVQTPEIRISSATEDTDPEPRSTPVHDVTTETRLRALDEKITPLYEYLGQHHAADIVPGEGPIEMALRLIRQHDEQCRTALGSITAESTCRFEYDRRDPDGVTVTCRTHGDQVSGTAPEVADWEDAHTADRISARRVPSSQSDEHPVPGFVWEAVAAVASLPAVVAAVSTPNPAWSVTSLIESSVRVALATVAQAACALKAAAPS